MTTQQTLITAEALMDTFRARLQKTCPELGQRGEIGRYQANLEVQHVLGALAYAATEHRKADASFSKLPVARYDYDQSSEAMAQAS